jgi:hypothetical protein
MGGKRRHLRLRFLRGLSLLASGRSAMDKGRRDRWGIRDGTDAKEMATSTVYLLHAMSTQIGSYASFLPAGFEKIPLCYPASGP